jgi:protein-S-isoprenylcysteine O-methyltransferase Ste14
MLRNELPRKGQWLFRYRSYVPLVLVPPLLLELYRNRARLDELPALDYWWPFGCLAVAFIGMLVRFVTAGYAAPSTSGRNTAAQKADSLNTTGFYSLSRNSLYFGNLIITLAIIAATRSWELTVVTFLLFLLYYERIIFAEEKFLEDKYGDMYRRWAASTPWLWPRLRGWKRPERSFSWRRAIRSEFNSLFGITTMLFAVEHGRAFARTHAWRLDFAWVVVFCVGAAVYIVCRTLKKRTRLLRA